MIPNQIIYLDPLYLVDGPESEALGIDMDQAVADMAVFHGGSCILEVLRVEGLITEDVAGTATQAQFKFDKRPTAGSDVDRGDGDIGTLDCEDADAGTVLYDDTCAGTMIQPGQEVVCQMTQRSETAASGHIRPRIVCRVWPEEPGNISTLISSPISS
jgi:hypothetical protein